MNDDPRSRPFGVPGLVLHTQCSELSAAGCPAPLEVHARLLRLGLGRGAVLMESADVEAPAGRRSLVLPRPWLRITVRGTRVRCEPLVPEAQALLHALARRLPNVTDDNGALLATFASGRRDPAMADHEALRSPCVLDALRAVAGLLHDPTHHDPLPGLYGAFGYELVDEFEELPPRRPDPFGDPDVHLVLALDAIVFDHRAGSLRVLTRGLPGDAAAIGERHRLYVEACTTAHIAPVPDVQEGTEAAVSPMRADVSDGEFLQGVRSLLEHIAAGDIFQAVLSRGLYRRSVAPPLAVYRELRRLNPSPYMFLADIEHGTLLGASPETCIRVTDGELEIRPIAGTSPRGLLPSGAVDHDLDGRLAVGLLLDRKEQAEHAMLVDLARNDVARVSVPGTRRLVHPFAIEKYSHVQHLVSEVRGSLLPGLDALHAYRACANMGTLTGAPKLRAMELICEHEPFARGFYGGAVGYLLSDGTFDSCIVIRSLRFYDGTYHTRAGAGIVADSVPEKELAETAHKARAGMIAVARAEAALQEVHR